MRAIKRTAQAEEDLHSEPAADRLLDRLDARWRLLAMQPFSGPAREDIGRDVRHVVAGEYLTFYRVANDEITILRVLHGRRNVTAEDIA